MKKRIVICADGTWNRLHSASIKETEATTGGSVNRPASQPATRAFRQETTP